MMKKSPFADIFKTMYIPQWRVAAAERKLKAFVSNGYEPVSFSPVGLSFYRVQFQCASPKDKEIYFKYKLITITTKKVTILYYL